METGWMIRHRAVLASTLLTLVLLPVVFVSASTERPMILVANCGTGSTGLKVNLTQVVPGSSGTVMFSCGTLGKAITVTSKGMVTPKFSLPPGYTSLGISLGTDCSPVFRLASGSALRFESGNHGAPITSYNYCASFSHAPPTGLQTFTITWSAIHAIRDIHDNDNDSN